MAQKSQLKDPTTGEKIYPVTSSSCVGMSDGSGNLDNKLTELEKEQNETKEQVSFSVKSVNNDETKVLDSSEEFSFCDSKGNVIAK